MFKFPVYFISDTHFSLDITEFEKLRREKLFSLFKIIKKNKGTLVIGGDFFDFWFDYRYVIPKGFNNLIFQLNDLNKSGVDIHYVLGNHDYWDFGSFKNLFGAKIYKSKLNFQINNSTFLVTHGDGLLKRHWFYRFIKKIIHSNFCISLFKLIHPDLGFSIAKLISKTNKKSRHYDKFSNQEYNELVDFAKSQWLNGIDNVLIGHYHQIGIKNDNGKNLIFMGDWLKKFTVTILTESGWEQKKW